MRVHGAALSWALAALVTSGCDNGTVEGDRDLADGPVMSDGGDPYDAGWTDCPAGTVPHRDGTCFQPGVESCSPGFVDDGAYGCRAILPSTPCGPAQIALPGDPTCSEVSSCGVGTWGDIPLEPETKFVDGAAAPGGDGSKARPFTRIDLALAAATDAGVTIAIAAGKYPVPLVVAHPARLIGRCASMVELQGGIRCADSFTGHLEVVGVSITTVPAVLVGCRASLTGAWLHDTSTVPLATMLVELHRTRVDGVSGAAITGLQVSIEDSMISGAVGPLFVAPGVETQLPLVRHSRVAAIRAAAMFHIDSSVIDDLAAQATNDTETRMEHSISGSVVGHVSLTGVNAEVANSTLGAQADRCSAPILEVSAGRLALRASAIHGGSKGIFASEASLAVDGAALSDLGGCGGVGGSGIDLNDVLPSFVHDTLVANCDGPAVRIAGLQSAASTDFPFATLLLDGVVVEHTHEKGASPGSGIRIEKSALVRLERCAVRDNAGVPLELAGGSVALHQCWFTCNGAETDLSGQAATVDEESQCGCGGSLHRCGGKL